VCLKRWVSEAWEMSVWNVEPEFYTWNLCVRKERACKTWERHRIKSGKSSGVELIPHVIVQALDIQSALPEESSTVIFGGESSSLPMWQIDRARLSADNSELTDWASWFINRNSAKEVATTETTETLFLSADSSTLFAAIQPQHGTSSSQRLISANSNYGQWHCVDSHLSRQIRTGRDIVSGRTKPSAVYRLIRLFVLRRPLTSK